MTKGKTVLLLGATGTIGRATAAVLKSEGYAVEALVRQHADTTALSVDRLHHGPVTAATLEQVMTQQRFDAVISCLASRTGAPKDAWAVDHDANSAALDAAVAHGVGHFVLLSAICVQKPLLQFQHAKLAFEAKLQAAPLVWSIVRPTAFFKSLSGQIDRLRQGKPFLLFGDGKLTRCKPISDRDTGRYLVRCLADVLLQNRILPVGGPGPAISPREQGQMLFEALGLEPRFAQVPIALMTGIIGVLTPIGIFSPKLREKAELARIGRYYATESMLVWDTVAGRYDPGITPEFGTDTLADHYRDLAACDISDNRGAHAVF